MVVETEYDPTDLAGQAERDAQRRQLAVAQDVRRRGDLVWLLSGRRGRRRVRRELREAGFDIRSDNVQTILDRHHGAMCFREGLRIHGVQLIWSLMRLLASGELPDESFKLLMTDEGDDT